jgi:tetratricopeptide (TPR) repeat protein
MEESAFSQELWAQIRKQFGHHCMRFSDFEKAQDSYKTSLELQPDDLDSIYCLANAQAREARVDEALKSLNEKSGLGKSAMREL